MNNNYCIHCSVDCKDNKTHRLSYDVTSGSLTTDGLREVGTIFNAIEERFPGVRFWITKDSEMIYRSSKESEEPLAYNSKVFVENAIQRENSETTN